jgi:protoporphyrinogen oxidase
MRVAVIGGGIAGGGAALELRKAGVEVALFDKNSDLGGRCRTFEWHGMWVIRGAGAFIDSEKNLVELARELAIYDEANIEHVPPPGSAQTRMILGVHGVRLPAWEC